MPETLPRETHSPAKGWSKGPMTVIIVLVVLIAAFSLAYALVLIL